MNYLKALFLFSLVIFCLESCSEDEEQLPDINLPTGSISGFVMHHEDTISNATAYIKFDVTEFPGTDGSNYDDLILVNETNGRFEFKNLPKGNYFIFGDGYDQECQCEVIGGVPITLINDDVMIEINLPVTE